MIELRRLLQDYAVFIVLLTASVGGHYWFVFWQRKPPEQTVRVPISAQQGVTRVQIQIVAARPKPQVELTEPVVELKPIETPELKPIELVKVELPPEKTITAEMPRPNAPPAPPPPPPLAKVEEQEPPPEEKPPEPPRKRKQKLAQVQDQPEIESLNNQDLFQDATQGSNVTATVRVKPLPPYPPDLWQRRIEATVMLAVNIDETGKPTGISVQTSSGYPAMDQSALNTVWRTWHFNPTLRNGKPIVDYIAVPIRFRLRDRIQ
jgi:protein TonB